MHQNLPQKLYAIALITVLAAWAPSAVAQSSPQADQLRSYNAQVLALESAAPAVHGAATDVTMTKLLALRAKSMQTLIVENPAEALALAFPADVLADLAASFPEQRGYLEQRGAWQGELEYLIEDDAAMTPAIARCSGCTATARCSKCTLRGRFRRRSAVVSRSRSRVCGSIGTSQPGICSCSNSRRTVARSPRMARAQPTPRHASASGRRVSWPCSSTCRATSCTLRSRRSSCAGCCSATTTAR